MDFAADTDQIASQLIAGGLDPERAMMMALRMAQSRQEQPILTGVVTGGSDIPSESILGGDVSGMFRREPTIRERVKQLPAQTLGAAEAIASLGSMVGLAVPSMVQAVATGSKDPLGLAKRQMYLPRTEEGIQALEGVGELASKIPDVGPLPELAALPAMAGAGRQAAQKVKEAGKAIAEDIQAYNRALTVPGASYVVRPKGGNVIGGDIRESVDRQLSHLKSSLIAGESPEERIPRHEALLRDPSLTAESKEAVQRHLDQEKKRAAVDNWIGRNLGNYIKKQMGTPDDPVRELAESGITHLNRPYEINDVVTMRSLPAKRVEEGFPASGLAQSPEARSWENLADRAIDIYKAGEIQPQAEKLAELQALDRQLSSQKQEIRERASKAFAERARRVGASEAEVPKIVESYLKLHEDILPNEFGTPEYKEMLKQFHTKRKELDDDLYGIARANPWIAKLEPDAKLYAFETGDLGFDHVIDVLRDDLDSGRIRPEQLSKVSVADAVRRTYEFDQEMMKKAQKAQDELASKLLQESPLKVYDNGYKWVKLPDAASSDEARKLVTDIGCQGGWCTQKDANALYYGAHGEGNNLYVLMSPDNRVHAQVHVSFPDKPFDYDDLMANPATYKQAEKAIKDWLKRNPEVDAPLTNEQINQAMRESGVPGLSPSITEIKPRANSWTSQMVADQAAKNPQYKATIQNMLADFVQTTKYPVEYDLENTGLLSIDPASDLAKAMRVAKQEVPRYVTNEELTKLLKKYKPQQYKQGGSVSKESIEKAAREIAKRFAGGGSVLAKQAAAAARAKPKSKKEVEKIAQRIAEQTQPGFVRKSPDVSVNPEEKSRVLYKLEQRSPGIVESLIEDKPIPAIDYEKRLGSVLLGVPGDPTMGQVAVPGSLEVATQAGKVLKQVGDVELQHPVGLYGGPRYGTTQDENYWASNISAARGIQNLVNEMAEKYGTENILGQYMKMSPESSRFAMHNLDALISTLQPEKLSKDKRDYLTKLVKEGDAKGKYPQFVGFDDPVELLLQAQMNSNLRKHISSILEKSKVAERVGFPFPGRVVQTAITEPELRNLETGVTGFAVGEMKPKGALTLSKHPTYEYDIPGKLVGKSKYPIPYELAFPDFMDWFRSKPELVQKVDPFNMLKSVGARQQIDPQYIDEIKMYEEAMKKMTGKKKGGLAAFAGGGKVISLAAKAAKEAKVAKSIAKEAVPVLSTVDFADRNWRSAIDDVVKYMNNVGVPYAPWQFMRDKPDVPLGRIMDEIERDVYFVRSNPILPEGQVELLEELFKKAREAEASYTRSGTPRDPMTGEPTMASGGLAVLRK